MELSCQESVAVVFAVTVVILAITHGSPSWWMCVCMCVCRERSDWNASSGSRPDRSVTRQGLWPRPLPCRSRKKERPALALVWLIRHPLRLTIRRLTHLKSSSSNSTATTSRDPRWRRRVAVLSATATTRPSKDLTPRHRSSTAPNSPTCYSRSVSSVSFWSPLLLFQIRKNESGLSLCRNDAPNRAFWLTLLSRSIYNSGHVQGRVFGVKVDGNFWRSR